MAIEKICCNCAYAIPAAEDDRSCEFGCYCTLLTMCPLPKDVPLSELARRVRSYHPHLVTLRKDGEIAEEDFFMPPPDFSCACWIKRQK